MKRRAPGLAVFIAAVALAGCGSYADAKSKGPNKPVPVLSVDAEGADSASVDGARVWNVRRGYNRVTVTTVSKATFVGYREGKGDERVAIPPTTADTRESGSVRLECVRRKSDEWYTSRDSSRSVLSNTTRTFRLPMRNPARCRVSVSLSAYNSLSDYDGFRDFPRYPGLRNLTVTYSLVQVRVQSVR